MKNLFSTTVLFLCSLFCNDLTAQCFTEQNFTTPGQSTFTLPGTSAESYLIEIETKGADGGDFLWNGNPQTDGGEGATIKASFIIPGGSDLLVVVGSSGFDAPGSPGGGGGGGGTAVILDNSNVLIAAGAGGGGGQGLSNTGQGGQANTNSSPMGGAGLGSAGGGGFNDAGGNGPASTGGGAGTLNGLGLGGAGGVTAGSGGNGFGGGGGGSGTVGGGGGGYKGGNGSDGSFDLNGKGGDSYVNSLFSGTVIFNTAGTNGGGNNNDGSVIITCTLQGSVEINLVSSSNPECFGDSNGSIEVSALGGIGPYLYSINGGSFGDSPVFSGLSAGEYTITVQDATGASDMLSVTLASPSEIVGEIINVLDNLCFGGSDGSIEVTATGGNSASGGYAFSLNGGSPQSSGLFINLPNGFYVITIIDDNFCSTQLTTSVSSPDDLILTLVSTTDVSCFGMNNGSCSVTASGGISDYLFAIDGGTFGTETIFFDLSGGTHTVAVLDANGCTEELTFFLNEPDAISFDLSSSGLICFGEDNGVIEVINLMGSDPFQFQLNDGAPGSESIFNGLVAGEYVVTVIDSAGCELTQNIELIAPDSLILSVVDISDVECGGDSTGSVILELQNGNGDITYSLGQTFSFTGSFQNLAPGDYTANATDGLGCSTSVSFMIQESASFTLSIDTNSPVNCFGGSDGSVSVIVTDGIAPIHYSINGTTFQDFPLFEGLTSGDYNIIAMDSTGCTKSTSVTVEEPTPMQFDHINISNVHCHKDNSGSIEFSISGGSPLYSYVDSDIAEVFDVNDTVTFDFLFAGETVIMIYDDNACLLTDTVIITQNDSLQLFVSELVADSCDVGATGYVDLNAVGGFAPLTISLNGESNTTGQFDNLIAGTYNASVTDSLGCTTELEFTISAIGGLVIDSVATANVSCHGLADGFIDIYINNSQGSISYFLDDSLNTTGLYNNLEGGTYNILATDESGCSVEVEIEITEPDPLNIDLVEANLSEGYITVIASGGTQPYRYSIDDKATFQDSATFTGLEFADYTIIVIDANGCESEYFYILDNVNSLELTEINVYPNPVQNILFIEFDEGNLNVDIEIIDRSGKIVKELSRDNFSINTNLAISIEDLNSGTYILKLRDRNRVAYRKIIVIK